MIPLVLFFLLIISIVGIILIRSFSYEDRLFILIPSGMTWGVTVYIFLLNFTAKFFPGRNGVMLSTLSLLILAIFAYFSIKPKKIQLPRLANLLILSFLVLIVIYFARLKMTSVFPVADSDMQWAYAASFARGNYPIKVPWQPDLNPNYHLGAYFLEGAILSLSSLPLITIHSILNTFFLIAGSLFVIFLLWDDKYSFKNLWLIIACLVIYISYGVIMFVFPAGSFVKSIAFKDIFLAITKYPTDIFAKGGAGAALVDLNSLSYLPARSLSLGLAFLALYFSLIKFKNAKIKILFFVILFSVSALVEESMFLPILGTIFLVFLLSYFSFIPNFAHLKNYRKILFMIIVLTLIIVTLQGGFLTDLLNQKNSSFNMKLPFFDAAFLDGLKMLKSFIFTTNGELLRWILPSPLLLTIIFLIFSFFTRNKVIGLIGLYSLAAFAFYLTIEYKYSPSTNLRLYSFGNIANGLGVIYLLFYIIRSKSLVKNFLVFIVMFLFVILPSLLPELINQSRQISQARFLNIRSQILITSNRKTPFEQISNWAGKNLPINSKLISIDSDFPTPKRSLQFEFKGIYTLLGPQYIHTNRPEPGTEFFDLSLTLNPSLFRETKTGYVYVESESLAYTQLPQFRKDDLENPIFFERLQSIDENVLKKKNIFYRLYKVRPEFINNNNVKEISDGTLQSLRNLIPSASKVYIADYGDLPMLPFWYRMATILALKDKDLRKNPNLTDYQIIETTINYQAGVADEKYDIYIAGSGQNPPYPSKLVWSNIFASGWIAY